MIFDEDGTTVITVDEDAYLKNKEILTISEAAQIAGLRRQTVYAAIKLKRLEAYKEGRKWLIPQESFQDYRRNRYDHHRRKINGTLIFDPQKGTMSIVQLCKYMADSLGVPYAYPRAYYAIGMGWLKASKCGSCWIITKKDADALIKTERDIRNMRAR